MRTLQEKYNAVLEGNFSKEQFRRDAVMQLPNVVSKFNSFEDMTTILKNRGMIAEAKKEEVTAYKKPEVDPIDLIAPDLLDDGIKAELEAKGIEGTPSEEEYAKAKEKAAKNLAKDPLHYKNAQTMPEMGEKMEKAKLHEETALDRAEDHASSKVQDKLKDIADTVAEKPASIAAAFRKKVLANPTHYAKMSAHELEKEFKKFKLEEGSEEDAELEYQANMEFDKYAGQPDPEITERLDYDTLTRMEGLVSIKVVDNFIEASQIIIKDLEQEGFEQDEIYEFLVDRLRTQEPISSADVVKELEDSEEEVGGPDVEDLYQLDPEYIATLKEAVKALIKKTLQD
jgi:hypothetical protein